MKKNIITIKSVDFMFALKPSSGYNTDTGIIGLSVSIVSAPVSDVQQCTPVKLGKFETEVSPDKINHWGNILVRHI